jgi:hypothetical protein
LAEATADKPDLPNDKPHSTHHRLTKTMRQRLSVAVAGLLSAWIASAALAQSPSPSFETASVKLNRAGTGSPMAVRPQNDRLTIVNVPGRQLVQMAFRVDVDQIEGAPSWLASEHCGGRTRRAPSCSGSRSIVNAFRPSIPPGLLSARRSKSRWA